MNLYACLQLALRALHKHRIRAMLTTLGVIVGVGSVIAMLAVGTGSQRRVEQVLEKMGTNHVTVRAGSATRKGIRTWAGTATRLTIADADAIRGLPDILAVAPIIKRPLKVRARGKNWATEVFGVTPEYITIRSWKLDQGEFFSSSHVNRSAHVCILGHTVVRELFGLRDPMGEVLIVKKLACRVIGVLSKKGLNSWGSDEDDVILLPITTMQRRLIGRTYIHRILIETRDLEAALSVQTGIRKLMRQRHRLQPNQEDDFRVGTQADLAQASEESARVFTWLLGSIASVSLLVGGIGIMNIMLVSVTERTREIGIRMALGARHRDVLAQFLFEASVLSGAGGITGIFAGISSALAIGRFSELPVTVTFWSVGIAFLFSVLVGIVFGLYPAHKAASLRPADALRYE
jgi:putative ABC transport system permease protein